MNETSVPATGSAVPISRFEGGDHMHFVVARQPTTFEGDSVVTWGDCAYSAKAIGGLPSGGEAYVTPRGVIR